MGLSQIPLLPRQHSHAAGALLLARWPSGAECPLGVAAEEDGLLDRTSPLPPSPTPYTHTASSREAKLCSVMVHCIPSKTLGQTPPP